MAATLISLAILAGVAVSVLRLAALPSARGIVGEIRLGWVIVLVAAAGTLVLVVLVAAQAPIALPILAGAAALGWAGAFVHARPYYGRRRGLPPGSLSLHDSLEALTDRSFNERAFARYGPVFKMAQFHRPVACVLGLERGRELLRSNADSVAPARNGREDAVPRRVVVWMARDDYAHYAPLFRGALAEVVSARGREVSAPLARDSCARLAAASSERPPLVGEVTDEYVLTCLLDLYFGGMLEAGDRAELETCLSQVVRLGARGRPTQEAVAAIEWFGELMKARASRADPAGAATFWTEIVRREPEALDDPTVLGNLCHLLLDARNNISGAATWTTFFLARNPAWLGVVRSGGETTDDRADPATAAVLESLRLARSEYVYRLVERPVEVEGFAIPAGWLIRVCVAESHLLDPPFTDLHIFAPERHLRERYGPKDLAPFGLDAHGCLGARLTLVLARSYVEALAGYDPTFVEAREPERGLRHWSHWTVKPSLRVALMPVD